MIRNYVLILSFLACQSFLFACDDEEVRPKSTVNQLDAPQASSKVSDGRHQISQDTEDTEDTPGPIRVSPNSSLQEGSLLTIDSQVRSRLDSLPEDISWNDRKCLTLESEDLELGPYYWIGQKGDGAKSRFVVIFGASLSEFNPKRDGGSWVNLIVSKLAAKYSDVTFIVTEGMWTLETLNKRKMDAEKKGIPANYQFEATAQDHYRRLKMYLQKHANKQSVQIIGFSGGANLALKVQQCDDANAENERVFNEGTIAFSPVLDLNETISRVRMRFKQATEHRSKRSTGVSSWGVMLSIIGWVTNGGSQPPFEEEEASERLYEEFEQDLQGIC